MGLTTRTFLAAVSILIIMAGCSRPHTRGQLPFPPAAPGTAEGSLFFADGSPATIAAFLTKARTADYIIIGEGHTSPCDHLLQAQLIDALAQSGLRFSVGLEMLSRDIAETVEQVNSGHVPLAAFPDAVKWKEVWGYPFELYRPVFEATYKHQLPIYALNVPQHIIRKVSRGGVEALTDVERASWIPETIIPPSEAQRESLLKVLDTHREMVVSPPPEQKQPAEENVSENEAPPSSQGMTGRMDRFFLIQSLWDTAMAEEAITARATESAPVVILAGTGHVEYGWGLAHRIYALEPDASILLITPWRALEAPDPEAADMRFYCPAVHRSRMGFTLMPKGETTTILAVAPDSRAAAAGLQAGDIILKVNDTPADSLWTLHKAAIESARQKLPLRFLIERNGKRITTTIPLRKKGS